MNITYNICRFYYFNTIMYEIIFTSLLYDVSQREARARV
jgi:hypothetical protein